jgi:hypothetical protein
MTEKIDELRAAAQKILREQKGKIPEAAVALVRFLGTRRPLMLALARDYLEHLAAEAAEQEKKDKGAKGTKGEKTPRPTQDEGDVSVKKYDVLPYRRRTHEQLVAARAAAASMVGAIYEARKVNGTAIGDLRWGELTKLVTEESWLAGSYLQHGIEKTETAILLRLIGDFAVVSDHSKKIRDVIPPEKLRELMEKARELAPRMVEAGARLYAETIATARIEV